MEVTSASEEETRKIALDFAKTLKVGDLIALYGNLGAGKTVFAQGLAKGLGIKQRILSPTFVFIRSYPIRFEGRKLTFYHIDLFRGENKEDYYALGLAEIFSQESITVVEWADKIKDILPAKRIDISIETLNEKARRIKISRN